MKKMCHDNVILSVHGNPKSIQNVMVMTWIKQKNVKSHININVPF